MVSFSTIISNADTDNISLINELGSTRVLLSTVAEEFLAWKNLVSDTVSAIFDCYKKSSEALIDALTVPYVQLNSAMKNVVYTILQDIDEIMRKRVEEMFQRSVEGALSDMDLIDIINKLRFSRFEAQCKDVLSVIKGDKIGKDIVKAQLKEMLGSVYMMEHAVSVGPTLNIEEAR